MNILMLVYFFLILAVVTLFDRAKRWVALDARACRGGGQQGFGRHRVEVADRQRNGEARGTRVLEPTVRRDDESILRDRPHDLPIGSLPAGDDHHYSIRHASFLRWYYPDQVLRVGGALAALSARSARAPHTLPAS